MTVAVLCHPFGTGHMTLPGAPGAFMFTRRIDVEHDARNFGPIGAIGFGIKKTQIGDEMFVVVAGQFVSMRSLVGNRRIERRPWLDHVRPQFSIRWSRPSQRFPEHARSLSEHDTIR